MENANTVLDQAIRDRLCILAHDLNNALAAIAGHCELIAEHAEPGSESERRLRQILTIVRVMAERINGHECRMAFAPAPNAIDPDTLLPSIKNTGKPLRPRNH